MRSYLRGLWGLDVTQVESLLMFSRCHLWMGIGQG